MINLAKNRQQILGFHRIRKSYLRVFKCTLNSRIFQLNRSGTRNATKTKQISVRVTSVQVINIGNTGYIRKIKSFEDRYLNPDLYREDLFLL